MGPYLGIGGTERKTGNNKFCSIDLPLALEWEEQRHDNLVQPAVGGSDLQGGDMEGVHREGPQHDSLIQEGEGVQGHWQAEIHQGHGRGLWPTVSRDTGRERSAGGMGGGHGGGKGGGAGGLPFSQKPQSTPNK